MYTKKTDIQIHSLSSLLSKAIKQCRNALDLSSKEFATKIHKSTSYIQDVEQGRIPVTSDVLEDCASAFGLSVSELFEIAISEKALVVANMLRK